MPTASLLHHYPTKTRLYSAILEAIAADLGETLLPTIDLDTTATAERYPEALDRLCIAYLDWVEEHPLRSRILLRELLDIEVRVESVPRWHLQPHVGRLSAFVRAGQEAGAFLDLDPLFFIVHMVGSVSYFAVGRTAMARMDGRSVGELTRAYRESARRLVRRLLVPGP